MFFLALFLSFKDTIVYKQPVLLRVPSMSHGGYRHFYQVPLHRFPQKDVKSVSSSAVYSIPHQKTKCGHKRCFIRVTDVILHRDKNTFFSPETSGAGWSNEISPGNRSKCQMNVKKLRETSPLRQIINIVSTTIWQIF